MEAVAGRGQVLDAPGKHGDKTSGNQQVWLRTVDLPCSFKVRRSDGKQKRGEVYQTQRLSNTGVRKRKGDRNHLPGPRGSGPPGQVGTDHPLSFPVSGLWPVWAQSQLTIWGNEERGELPPPPPLPSRKALTTRLSVGWWWLQWGENWPSNEDWRLNFYVMILAELIPIIELK